MIEAIVNAFQLLTTGICTLVALRRGFRYRKRPWFLLALASGVFFLGDLYWELFLIFFGDTPKFSFISYIGWYASYLFLLLLVLEFPDDGGDPKKKRILWIGPAFAAGMCLFYLQWGDLFGNVISALLMGTLFWNIGSRLLSLKGKNAKQQPEILLLWSVLLFCLLEYAAWTASCFGVYDSLAHPYFWFDILLSADFLIFPWALKKAVAA